jgi:hypothetical protein
MKTAALANIAAAPDTPADLLASEPQSETQRAGHLSPAPEQQKLDEARDVAGQGRSEAQ